MRIIPVITIKKCIRNRILKCGSDPKQERHRGKGNDVNADLMYKPTCDESNISIEEQTNKEPRETLKPSLEALVDEYSDGFKALARSSYTIREFNKNIATKREATPTELPTRFIDAEVIKTEKLTTCV
jgi:hypothetical protein